MGTMATMGKAGDIKTIWDPGNEDETAMAKEQFKKLTGKGFAAFRVNKKGDKGEQITEFDPLAASIIIVPPMAGG